ncbi:MAG TPA: family 78 glycoside hydrolase catalytic domain, partial [Phycisphaerales bacterium]|nr:family 78 glycoside hydrolase catalytic domain [Phycisphaerales bacterium]
MLAELALSLSVAAYTQPRPVQPLEAQWIAPASRPVGPEPKWIWVDRPGEAAPTVQGASAPTAWVCRQVELPAGSVRTARLSMAADNEATAYLNGEKVLATSDWSAPASVAVTLREGVNTLSIEARNSPSTGGAPAGSNPAGLVARLDMDAGGSVVTDASWRGASERWQEFPGAGVAAAVRELGAASAAPWRLASAAFDQPQACPIMRRSFTLAGAPAKGTVKLIGLGHYELRCNGERVGDALINQAWSQYDRTLFWQEFDLTPHLRAGENVLAVSLGGSFWVVPPANHPRRFVKTDVMPDFSQGRPHLLWLTADVEGPDGAKTRVVSDDRWRWTRGPLTFSHVYAGEDYDARLAPAGWDRPGFDDGAWQAPAFAAAPSGRPARLSGPPMRAFEVFAPTEIKEPRPGVFTYVFPQNCSSVLRFTVEGAAGATVRMKPCEFMDESGSVKFTYTWGTGKDIWHDYTLRGGGPESHQTLFCYVGAQYVEVTGAVPHGRPNPSNLPVLRSLEMVHVRADCPLTGEFTCSSDLHNGAHRLIDWSIRSNLGPVITDCPHREKNGWQEQNWHMARAMSYRYDMRAMLEKTCQDLRDAQSTGGGDDGFIPTNAPWYLVGRPRHDMFNDAPEWSVACVLVPWHLYEWYGDRAALETNFDTMKRFTAYLGRTAKDGVITSNLGDWYDYGHGKGDGPSRWTPNEVSATAIWALAAKTVADAAEVLGRRDDAAAHRALYERIRADFQRRFYDAATATTRNNGSCQAGTAAALCVGLIPEPDRVRAVDAIVADLEKRGHQQTTGEVLQVFLVRALSEAGRSDVLHRVYNREERGGYGYMVRSGLTTLPESWDARPGTGNSMCHLMLGHLMEWHFADVCGIRQAPGSVGWTGLIIAPRPPARGDASPNAIRSAQASFISPRGRIASRWVIENGAFALTCEVPAGVTAKAVL